jgi:hypothetical protein
LQIHLPAEVWERVAQFLPLEDRCTLSCTSLVLSNIVRPFVFETLRFGVHSSLKNSLRRAEALAHVRSIQRNVQSIIFHLYYANFRASTWSGSSLYTHGTSRAFGSKANAALLKALPKLPQLNTLVLSVNHITSHSWPVVIGLPALNHLELYSADGATPAPIPASLPESCIKSFTLRYVGYEDIVNALLAHLAPKLEALHFIYCSGAESILNISFPPFPRLCKFIIDGGREPKMPQGTLVRLLARTPTILHLEMNHNSSEKPLPETFLPNLRSLTLYCAAAPFTPTFASPRAISELTVKMTGGSHTEESTRELLSAISGNISSPSFTISGGWMVRGAIFHQLQWTHPRNLRSVHLKFPIYFFSDAQHVSLPTSVPCTLERITVELRRHVQGYNMMQISLPNHPELRDWPEALIMAQGNKRLKEARLELWRICDGPVGSKRDEEAGWWKKAWRVDSADGSWQIDTSSGQGFYLDEVQARVVR